MSVTGIVPHLIVSDANAASAFYQKAFGAREVMRMPADDGKRLMHCELAVGSAKLYLCDDFPEYCGGVSKLAQGPTGVTIHLDVPNCDEAFTQATAAGAKATMPPMDMFWGDRYAKIIDPFGHEWSMCHRLTPEQHAAAAKAWEAMKANWGKGK